MKEFGIVIPFLKPFRLGKGLPFHIKLAIKAIALKIREFIGISSELERVLEDSMIISF